MLKPFRGISPSIAQSKRGDDPDFLNTAWTIQVIRGFVLWLAASVLAYPLSLFYEQPDLAIYLPIAALSLLVAGFNPTRIETAHRHLLMGRLTALDLLSQVLEIALLIMLALWLNSVMALVIGGVIGVTGKLILTWAFLPGDANRFRWEWAAARELVEGAYISIELNTRTPVPERDGQDVFIMQEDPAYLTSEGWRFFRPRQEQLYLIG